MEQKTTKRTMVYKSTLKSEFGLTDRLIRQLGEPDELVRNPHYKSGPPASLYDLKRVKKFVRNRRRTIAALAAKRPRRSEAAAKGVKTKVGNLLKKIDDCGFELQSLPTSLHYLSRSAQDHADMRYGFDSHRVGPDGVIAFVRHNYTNYEQILKEIQRRVGREVGYDAIRTRFDDQIEQHILATFPDFYSYFDRSDQVAPIAQPVQTSSGV